MKRNLEGELNLSFTSKGKRYIVDSLGGKKTRLGAFHLETTKYIIEQTKISDRTVRRILKKFVDNKTIESVGNAENTPNKKYRMAELKICKKIY